MRRSSQWSAVQRCHLAGCAMLAAAVARRHNPRAGSHAASRQAMQATPCLVLYEGRAQTRLRCSETGQLGKPPPGPFSPA